MLTCPVAIGSFSSREVVVVVVAPTAKKTGMFVVSIRVLRKMFLAVEVLLRVAHGNRK